MGLSISYPPDDYLPMEDDMDRLFIRSLSFDNLGAIESPPASLDALSSARLIIRGPLSFKKRDSDPIQAETTKSIVSPKPDKEICHCKPTVLPRYRPMENLAPDSPVVRMVSPKHQAAAVTLQKVYKSFRTRRQLADCAVLVEQRWWKLLDFALLRHNSVSFFEIEKPETALSRWSRARMRAAKVGKGLSKDEKAQKLALQHWLEAIDPRHRYGHNLHYYYQHWLHCESKQPFFYWLDIGEGKEVNLEEYCPRWKLLQQCIRYLGPKEREFYEVIIEDRRLMYKLSQKILDTSEGPKDSKWIFVLSTTKVLYVGSKSKGTFQHSSFLAGGATSAAGRLVVENGILKAVWPHSGHYRPTEENFRELMNYLKVRNVDLTNVKLSASEGEEDDWLRLRTGLSHLDLTEYFKPDKQEDNKAQPPLVADEDKANDVNAPIETTAGSPVLKRSSSANRLQLKRPPRLMLNASNLRPWQAGRDKSRLSWKEKDIEQDAGTFGDCLDFCKENLFMGSEDGEEVVVPQEKILNRINSKKAMRSYQLGKQLSLRWSTGAGPRIGCVRDYPPELQFRALEQVSLSPRGTAGSARFATLRPSPRAPPPASPTPRGLGTYALVGTPTARLQHGVATG